MNLLKAYYQFKKMCRKSQKQALNNLRVIADLHWDHLLRKKQKSYHPISNSHSEEKATYLLLYTVNIYQKPKYMESQMNLVQRTRTNSTLRSSQINSLLRWNNKRKRKMDQYNLLAKELALINWKLVQKLANKGQRARNMTNILILNLEWI